MARNELDNPTREGYVELARQFVGIKEGSAEHSALISKYNDIQGKYKVTTKSAWCAIFVSYINLLSGGNHVSSSFPNAIKCTTMVDCFRIKKRYRNNDSSFIPQYGDIVFYDWDCDGKADHVGIISSVADGNSPSMLVIEGNYSNSIKVRSLKYNDGRILGYGLPRFR